MKKQIISGILIPTAVWSLPTLMSGTIYLFEPIDLGYAKIGLVKGFFVLFAAYNIFVAVLSKKKKFEKFFLCHQIVVSVPICAYIICFALTFLITNPGPVSTALYVLSMPLATACLLFENEFWMIFSAVVIGLSPLVGFLMHKYIKE